MKNWMKGGIIFISLFILTRAISVINYMLTPITYDGLVVSWKYSEVFSLLFSLQGEVLPTILSNLIPLISFFLFGAALFYIIYNNKLKNWMKGGIILIGITQFMLAFDIFHSLTKFFNILIVLFQYINSLLWFPYDYSTNSLLIKITLTIIYLLLLFLMGSFIGVMFKKQPSIPVN